MSGTTSNGQRAAHAPDGISAHSRAVSQRRGLPGEDFFLDFEREAEPGSDQARLADLLRDLQHYADRRGLSFAGALGTARWEYE